MTRVLVTGGAGYVGSHCSRRLVDAGIDVVVVDNLSQGHPQAVSGELVEMDIRDRQGLTQLLSTGFDAVLHFAAKMSVGESNDDPVGYFDTNVAGTLSLLESMRESGCERLVFSSTCAVYGVPEEVPISEKTPFGPISPYGETKAVVERILDLARAKGHIASCSLRYFNAAGASHDGWIGEAHDPETHLIPVALEALETGRLMKIFGTDHPTPDGTCVRDYVHVEDLAEAHLRALERLLRGDEGGAFNLGSGSGYSVREVLSTIEAVTGRSLNLVETDRREGDPPVLVSNTMRSKEVLGWQTTRSLTQILEDAWRWHLNPRFGPKVTSKA